MSNLSVDIATYIPGENLALVYTENDAFFYKNHAGETAAVAAEALKVLGVKTANLPCLVFEEDLIDAASKTVADTSNVTVALGVKASTKYVQQLAKQKVNKSDFLTAVANIESKQAATDAQVGEIDTDLNTAEGKITTLEGQVADLQGKLGGGDDGEDGNLIVRVADLEAATNVDVTANAPIVTNIAAEGETAVNKINPAYQPMVQFNGEDKGNLAMILNVIGDGALIPSADGKSLTLRIGPNLNSSIYTEKTGGVTDGSVSATYASGITNRTVGTNGSIATWKKGTNTVTITSAGEVHFNGLTDTFKLTVTGKDAKGNAMTYEHTFGPITTASSTYTDYVTGSTTVFKSKLTTSGFGAEAKAGATGYSGKVTIVINIENLGFGDGYISFKVEQIGTKLTTGGVPTYAVNNKFYLINDTTTKANVTTGSAITIAPTGSKVISGVTYLTGANATLAVSGIENAGLPATGNASNSTVTFTRTTAWANGTTAAKTTTVAHNGTTASVTVAVNDGPWAAASCKYTVGCANCNGTGKTTTIAYAGDLLVDTTDTTASTATVEYFNVESQRLTNALAAWNSTVSLADGAAGAEGLMVADGALQYPAGTFTGYNNGLTIDPTGSGTPAVFDGSTQPDYSACSGERSFVRKFTRDGSHSGGKIKFKHSASIAAAIKAGTLKVSVAKTVKGAFGGKWYDIGFGYDKVTTGAYVPEEEECGKSSSEYNTEDTTMVFSFDDGDSENDIYVKIRMTDAVATIKEMEFL
jgi:hypothetical protein